MTLRHRLERIERRLCRSDEAEAVDLIVTFVSGVDGHEDASQPRTHIRFDRDTGTWRDCDEQGEWIAANRCLTCHTQD